MTTRTPTQIASDLTKAILAGDVDAVSALYHDDAVVWQNTSGRELSKKQMLRIIGFLATGVDGLRYEDVHVQETPAGFVQQHTLCCLSKAGVAVRAAACLVATVHDGRIARLDEYLDSAAIAALS